MSDPRTSFTAKIEIFCLKTETRKLHSSSTTPPIAEPPDAVFPKLGLWEISVLRPKVFEKLKQDGEIRFLITTPISFFWPFFAEYFDQKIEISKNSCEIDVEEKFISNPRIDKRWWEMLFKNKGEVGKISYQMREFFSLFLFWRCFGYHNTQIATFPTDNACLFSRKIEISDLVV